MGVAVEGVHDLLEHPVLEVTHRCLVGSLLGKRFVEDLYLLFRFCSVLEEASHHLELVGVLSGDSMSHLHQALSLGIHSRI